MPQSNHHHHRPPPSPRCQVESSAAAAQHLQNPLTTEITGQNLSLYTLQSIWCIFMDSLFNKPPRFIILSPKEIHSWFYGHHAPDINQQQLPLIIRIWHHVHSVIYPREGGGKATKGVVRGKLLLKGKGRIKGRLLWVLVVVSKESCHCCPRGRYAASSESGQHYFSSLISASSLSRRTQQITGRHWSWVGAFLR